MPSTSLRSSRSSRSPRLSRLPGLLACALVFIGAARCSSSNSNGTSAATSMVIGTSGGTLASSDGVLDVVVPPGAVSSDVTITVTPTSGAPAGAIGTAYGVGPLTTVLQAPVTIVFHYASIDLGGEDPSKLFVATYDGSWQDLSGPLANAASKTISGTTLQFSLFGIVEATVGPEPDGGEPITNEGGQSLDGAAGCSGTYTPTSGGSDCSISEACGDGHQYEILCDPTANTCSCRKDAVQTTTTTVMCTALTASSLALCGYPVGTIAQAPLDSGSAACKFVVTQSQDDAGLDGGGSCSVTENCGPAGEYELDCGAANGKCDCKQNGSLGGIVEVSCAALTAASIMQCGYPGP